MSEFVVHTIPGSPFARAVLATLEEKGATYRIAPILPGGQKSEPHLSLHAFGRMPVLQQGSFVLYETQAILRYLDRILPEPSLTPRDAKHAARMDQAININDWYLFQGVSNVIVAQRVIFPALFGLAPDEAAIAEAMPKAHVVFGELARLLGNNKYFAGDLMSLADLSIAPQMDMFVGLPEWEPLTKAYQNLLTWLATMSVRPSMKATTWQRVSELAKAS
jgi:glutathione S-transferase